MRQEVERDLELPHDRHAGLARGDERGRIGRDARAGHDERAAGDAREIMSSTLRRHAELLERRGRMVHRVAGPRVAGVDVGARAPQQLGGGAAAARQTEHADLPARPGGGQRFRERADWHPSAASGCSAPGTRR
jgi:hypothetical protein